ncbi:MAG: LysR family transcriptional regulator [Gammaproteobacteria bacterium]|jgi:DNA-binding transcriptional LysR family regulator|nr:LysR family transcriptional regulator [Gammaproteobacteria bacterium]
MLSRGYSSEDLMSSSDTTFNRVPTDLRKLQHALVLATEGSFARASTQLCITQSALTRSIQALEREMGLRLFDRSHVKVVPTPAGKLVLEQAQALLLQANSLARDVELIRGANLGSITFGASPVAAATIIPSAVADIVQQHPQLHIALECSSSLELLPKLLNEQIEFFVGNTDQFDDRPDVSMQALARIEVRFFVRAGHPLAAFDEVGPGQLAVYPLISPRMATERLSVLPKIYGAGDPTVQFGRFVCDETSIQKSVALNSNAVLLTAWGIVRDEVADGRLKVLKVVPVEELETPLKAAVSIVKLSGRSFSPTA